MENRIIALGQVDDFSKRFNVFFQEVLNIFRCPQGLGLTESEERCFTYVYQREGEWLGRGISQWIGGRNHHGVIGVKIQLAQSPGAKILTGSFFWKGKGIGPVGEPGAGGKVWLDFVRKKGEPWGLGTGSVLGVWGLGSHPRTWGQGEPCGDRAPFPKGWIGTASSLNPEGAAGPGEKAATGDN